MEGHEESCLVDGGVFGKELGERDPKFVIADIPKGHRLRSFDKRGVFPFIDGHDVMDKKKQATVC